MRGLRLAEGDGGEAEPLKTPFLARGRDHLRTGRAYLRSFRESTRPGSPRYGLAIVGYFLVLVGLVATVLPLCAFLAFFTEDTKVPMFRGAWRDALVISSAVALMAPALGELVFSFQRRTALFLRRFRQAEPTRALGFAINGAIGRSWRLVTLDDSEILPVGVRKGARRAAVALQLRVAMLLFVGLTYGAEGLDAAQSANLEQAAPPTLVGSGENGVIADAWKQIRAWLGLRSGEAIEPLDVVRSTFIGIGMWLAFKIAFSLLLPAVRLRRGELGARVRIERKRHIRHAVRRVARQNRRLFTPQLVVVTVDSAVWRQTVRRFVSRSSLVITDVSELSDNLLWEIETLKPQSNKRWVFVGERGEDSAHDPPPDIRAATPYQARLSIALQGESVLLYGGSDAAMVAFEKALRGTMYSRPTGRTAPTVPPTATMSVATCPGHLYQSRDVAEAAEAPTMSPRSLLMAEELALVAMTNTRFWHRDDWSHDGKEVVGLNHYLAALLVAELVLDGHAETEDQCFTVRAGGRAPRQRTLAAAARVVALHGPQTETVLGGMDTGLARLLGRGTWSAVIAGLVDAGVMAPPKGWWSSGRYRLVEPERLKAVESRLRAAASDGPVDPRTALLLRMIPSALIPVIAPDRKARRQAQDHMARALPSSFRRIFERRSRS